MSIKTSKSTCEIIILKVRVTPDPNIRYLGLKNNKKIMKSLRVNTSIVKQSVKHQQKVDQNAKIS